MFTRTASALIVLLWSSSMGWLLAHDVWPAWSAPEPPRVRADEWLRTEGRENQAGLFDVSGRLGTIWTTYIIDQSSVRREDTVYIERFPVPVAPLLVSADAVFDREGRLDEFTVRVSAKDVDMRLHGERFHSDFSFELATGAGRPRTFKLPLSEAGLVSGAFNPFMHLTDLRVGQKWRMQVFNPVSAVTGMGDRFIPMLVQVTQAETITTSEGPRTCLVIESPGARAWVDTRGVVHRQEITLPLGGRFTMVREEFDEESLRATKLKSDLIFQER
jgi:hypothetical protein